MDFGEAESRFLNVICSHDRFLHQIIYKTVERRRADLEGENKI